MRPFVSFVSVHIGCSCVLGVCIVRLAIVRAMEEEKSDQYVINQRDVAGRSSVEEKHEKPEVVNLARRRNRIFRRNYSTIRLKMVAYVSATTGCKFHHLRMAYSADVSCTATAFFHRIYRDTHVCILRGSSLASTFPK